MVKAGESTCSAFCEYRNRLPRLRGSSAKPGHRPAPSGPVRVPTFHRGSARFNALSRTKAKRKPVETG